MTSKEETWSRGTNSRLSFDVNVILNLSNGKRNFPSETNKVLIFLLDDQTMNRPLCPFYEVKK